MIKSNNKIDQHNIPENRSKKTKIVILGTCISRDPFSNFDTCFDITAYIARSSFCSMFAYPMTKKIPIDKIEFTSPWQKRMCEIDLEKSLPKIISNADFDLLVIDFIDERFPILVEDEKVITMSFGSQFLQNEEFPKLKLINNKNIEFRNRWLEGWIKFADFVKQLGIAQRCVLHKVLWASKISDGSLIPHKNINAENEVLNYFYEMASETLPEMKIIDVPNHLCISDAKHKWGPAPYHYTSEEQIYFLNSLSKIRNDLMLQEPFKN